MCKASVEITGTGPPRKTETDKKVLCGVIRKIGVELTGTGQTCKKETDQKVLHEFVLYLQDGVAIRDISHSPASLAIFWTARAEGAAILKKPDAGPGQNKK